MSNTKKQQKKDVVVPVNVMEAKVLKVEKPEGFKTAKEVEKEIQLEQDNTALKVIAETILKELKETKLMVTELKKILATQNDIINEMINDGTYEEDEENYDTQMDDDEVIDNPKKKKK